MSFYPDFARASRQGLNKTSFANNFIYIYFPDFARASSASFDRTRQQFEDYSEGATSNFFAGNKETNEDCDSGIMVNDSSSVLACSVVENDNTRQEELPKLVRHKKLY